LWLIHSYLINIFSGWLSIGLTPAFSTPAFQSPLLGVSMEGGKVEELSGKAFVEKMSFEPEVEERRSDR